MLHLFQDKTRAVRALWVGTSTLIASVYRLIVPWSTKKFFFGSPRARQTNGIGFFPHKVKSLSTFFQVAVLRLTTFLGLRRNFSCIKQRELGSEGLSVEIHNFVWRRCSKTFEWVRWISHKKFIRRWKREGMDSNPSRRSEPLVAVCCSVLTERPFSDHHRLDRAES